MSPVPSFWMTCLQSFGPPEYEPWRGWPFRGVLSSTLWHGTMPWKEPYHPLAKHAVLVSETNSNLCITSLLHHAHICPQTRPRSNACGYDLYFSYPGFHRITDVHGCSCPQSDLWQFMCMVWVLPHPHLYPVGMRTDSPGPRCTPHRRTPMVGCLQMPREPSRRGIQWGRFSEVSEMDCSIRIIRPWHACTRCFFSTHCTMSSNVIQCHPMSSNVIQCHPMSSTISPVTTVATLSHITTCFHSSEAQEDLLWKADAEMHHSLSLRSGRRQRWTPLMEKMI